MNISYGEQLTCSFYSKPLAISFSMFYEKSTKISLDLDLTIT